MLLNAWRVIETLISCIKYRFIDRRKPKIQTKLRSGHLNCCRDQRSCSRALLKTNVLSNYFYDKRNGINKDIAKKHTLVKQGPRLYSSQGWSSSEVINNLSTPQRQRKNCQRLNSRLNFSFKNPRKGFACSKAWSNNVLLSFNLD